MLLLVSVFPRFTISFGIAVSNIHCFCDTGHFYPCVCVFGYLLCQRLRYVFTGYRFRAAAELWWRGEKNRGSHRVVTPSLNRRGENWGFSRHRHLIAQFPCKDDIRPVFVQSAESAVTSYSHSVLNLCRVQCLPTLPPVNFSVLSVLYIFSEWHNTHFFYWYMTLFSRTDSSPGLWQGDFRFLLLLIL